jgi:hypothetical protein
MNEGVVSALADEWYRETTNTQLPHHIPVEAFRFASPTEEGTLVLPKRNLPHTQIVFVYQHSHFFIVFVCMLVLDIVLI